MADADLKAGEQAEQSKRISSLLKTIYNDSSDVADYRLRFFCEVKTFELTGLSPGFRWIFFD